MYNGAKGLHISTNFNRMATNKINGDTQLTPLQEKAIYLLASGKSITDTAKEIKADRATLYNWQNVSEFEAYYNKVRLEFKEQARNELVYLFTEAITSLKICLQSDNENIKLKAATYILEHIQDFQTGHTTKEKIEKERMFEW